jgi:putative ABC transport system permease protein
MALRGVRRGAGVPILSAVGAIAAAVAVLVAVAAGAVTIRDVTSHPARYGADFDAIVGFFDDHTGLPEEEARALVAGHPDVIAASGFPGSTVMTDHGELWVQAFVPIDGAESVRPVITSGREPNRPDEIALGTLTMRDAGLRIGDQIELRPLAGNRPPVAFTVVGTAMVTDNFEPRVGAGGVLDPAGLERIAPEASGGIVLRVTDGSGRDAALARVQEAYPDQFMGVAVPTSLQNVERIAGLPVAIAGATAALAAVTLTHALLVCVRRQRRDLAVHKSLGFTRRQVVAAVMTEATVLASAGLALGIPLGVIGARSGWRAIAGGLGLSAEVTIPIGVVAGSVLGVLLVANLAAAVPGWRAGRIPAAEALRTE